MKITIVSKKPPGGRCTLYGYYAQVVADALGGAIETTFPGPEDEVQPPGFMLEDRLIIPADGLILSPSDVHDGLGKDGSPSLLARLEEAEARFMEECDK
ncbi:MAG: hypothetical protein HQL44_02030 [Alphaproteobacteria bacterium]|nr:hypothetical protein [Alphaproteobacteria bacterium]